MALSKSKIIGTVFRKWETPAGQKKPIHLSKRIDVSDKVWPTWKMMCVLLPGIGDDIVPTRNPELRHAIESKWRRSGLLAKERGRERERGTHFSNAFREINGIALRPQRWCFFSRSKLLQPLRCVNRCVYVCLRMYWPHVRGLTYSGNVFSSLERCCH